ncbi:serine carboxypeptidase [Zymoseptoria tritici IPO323]|uniref:Serine carboxypeptidase n=1 Tax=Zymoseptoria tritici (strain CBS 115943 / IPO323) TaxID=336722 RepID=F9X5K5_ZYMTI|nr:serine carboxypeptidase [Zymoseptoria tritici IPO323]EGP89515.1 serine carboxypeptidase [Zymoseptoria tritici IPO323]
MRFGLALLAGAAAVEAHNGHHDRPGKWDWNGGYPYGGCNSQHLTGTPPKPGSLNATFAQLIDHSNPSLGTFEQFFFYDTTYWKGPGSPVILFTPGEVNATRYTSYLTTNRTTGVLAQEIGAATIVLEHRYWGVSSPFSDLTTANLRYLTLENSIKDLTYFARTVELPFASKRHPSNAKDVPWVTMGGSYSGALSAWTASVDPGTYWAYHASSAPVQAISDYWSYFLPVQQGMPKNCSQDVSLVIDHMDNILINGTEDEAKELKALFGLQDVSHNDDFMAALENGPWLWQGNQFYNTSGFFTWCDYVEDSVNATGSSVAGPSGVGVEKALAGYAKWFKEVQLPGYCESYDYFHGENNTECFDTYNPDSPMFTDTSLSNTVDRQWVYMTCNEPFGYWQTGAPADRPSIVSRLVTPEYWIRMCGLYFPAGPDGETYGIAKGVTEEDVNAYTGGWDITNTTRLIYVNGGYDPWRESGVSSSDLRPGGPLQSTNEVPVLVVPGGFHTSDLITMNGAVNAGAKEVIDCVVAQLKEWVGEWPKHGRYWRE